ncbi:MAG: hemolysin family protein [Clostridia bacterium]
MILQLVILCILILLNAYFAATEIAFISLNDAKIEKQAKEGNKKAKQIEKMLKNPSKFLATIQIGITLAGFLSSAFASDAFADILAPALHGAFPFISIEVFRSIAIILITLILSFFTLVFGELVPKRIAMKYYEKISYATIGIIKVISVITAPFVKILTVSTNLISKLFGISENEEEIVTEEEIKMMIDEGEEKGTIDQEEKEMIHNIFEFDDITASEVMTHRTDVFAIEVQENIEDIIKQVDELKYSRIPVYEETIDNIQGILFVKDLLKYWKNKSKIKIADIMREAYFVSESKPINELFRDLQRSKKQMAIVVDEYGGTAGVVTMEDLLEEIVGNIFDEYDEAEEEYQKIDDGTFLISGSVSIYELKKILGIEIPEGDYDTLSGYLLELLGRIPANGEKPEIETEKVNYKIETYEDRRILWVKACKNKTVPTEEIDETNK